MRVKGLGKEYAELLRTVGVDTVRELKYRNPGKLAEAMAHGQQEAQARAPGADRKGRRPLDRRSEETAAENQLLNGSTGAGAALTPPAGPRKAGRMSKRAFPLLRRI